MSFTISKQFAFSASHQLAGLRDGHPCGRLHGHNYVVELVLEADELDSTGFVRDYGDLVEVADYIDRMFDHRHLNDQMVGNPTAEQLALLIFATWFGDLRELVAVRVSETPKTWAEYRP